MSDSLVSVKSVNKTYQRGGEELVVLDDLSLEVPEGDFLALMGPSGSGKSTLLNLIGGLDTPTTGSVEVDGERLDSLNSKALSQWRSSHVGFIFQFYNLLPVLTAFRNVELPLLLTKLSGSQRKQHVETALNIVSLADRASHKPNELSGGQQQRVALARALAPRPKVLLLDEPLSALDLKLRKEMQLELKRLQHETGITFVFVTHDQEEALTMSDRVAVMRDGVIHQIGSPVEIYNHPDNRFVADFIGESNFIEAELIAADGKTGKVKFTDRVEFDATLPSATVETGPVTVIIRPEHVTLTTNNSHAHLRGTVNNSVYFGTDTHYYLTLDSGEEFVIRQQNQRGEKSRVNAGTQVGILINEDCIQVLSN